MKETFPKSSVLLIEDMVSYADGVVSKQVLKNEAGNITLFSFDRDQGLSGPSCLLSFKWRTALLLCLHGN